MNPPDLGDADAKRASVGSRLTTLSVITDPFPQMICRLLVGRGSDINRCRGCLGTFIKKQFGGLAYRAGSGSPEIWPRASHFEVFK